ncbi:MAG: terminase family protein [Deltaproteobacteria bacterium]|nr:terminase family protein [Deltaproteobacteria bacterium]
MAQAKLLPFRELLPDGTLRFHFHPGQSLAWDAQTQDILVLAGSQGGKTCWGPAWFDREIKTKGPGDYLIVTATYPLLNLKLLPEFLDLFQHTLKLGRYYDSKQCFEFHDGKTRVIFGTAKNPESLESATAKAAWLDEAGQKQFKREAYEAVRRRLTIHSGRMLITTTPYGLGWLKLEFYDKWKAGGPDITVVQFTSMMNPTFPRSEYEKERSRLPGWKFAMFHEGRFTKPAGLIYDSFDEATAMIPRFEIPKDWPCYTGHDFGAVHTAAMWYAQDPGTGYLYAYREYKTASKGHVTDHANKFKELSTGERIVKRMGGAHGEEGWRDAYLGAGWPILEPQINDVEVQIDGVYAMHKQGRLFVFDDLHQYLDEKNTYSRKLDDEYEPTDEIEDKATFHLMDAERYIVSDFKPLRAKKDSKYEPAVF